MKKFNMYRRYEPVEASISFFFPDDTTESEDRETYFAILHELKEIGDRYSKDGKIDRRSFEISICESMSQGKAWE